MPRGAPDYSNVKAYGELHRLDDHAELAARLGSPVLYDRPGRVVHTQSFEDGLQGGSFGTGGVDSVGELVTDRSCHGSFSIKLDAGDGAGDYVEWRYPVYYFPTGKTGFEISLCPDTDFDNVRFIIFTYDGTTMVQYIMRYYPDGGLWQVKDSVAGYVTVLSGYTLQQGTAAWHPFKLVVDTTNKEYVRFLIDYHVVDLSDYTPLEQANAGGAQIEIGVTVYSDPAAHAPCYFDRIVVTQAEP